MNRARRRWLTALCLAGFATRAAGGQVPQASASPLLPRWRWASGNARLAPFGLLDGRLLFAGERDLGLIELDAGRPLWQRPHGLPGGVAFRPRAAGDVVLCAGAGGLSAWRAADGVPLWRRAARRQIGVPCVAGEQVYCGDGHELVALDLRSGAERWRFAAIADTLISYAPAVAGDTVYVGPGDGRLYALSAADGRLRWRQDRMAEWQYLRQLHVSGDLLVAGSYKEKLYGLDLETGAQRWEFAAGNFINSHHVSGDRIYLWSPTGWLFAIDATQGRVRWRHRTTGYGGKAGDWAPVLAELATVADHLFALDLANTIHILDAADGGRQRSHRCGERLRPFVLPLDDKRFLAGNDRGEVLFYAT